MELLSPIKKNSSVYVVPIETVDFLNIRYPSNVSGSNTTPPSENIDFKQYISAIALLYETYSMKWFNKKIPAFFFIQHLSHKWNHASIPPYTSSYLETMITVQQVWCPETITVQPNLFQIEWILQNSEYKLYSAVPGLISESEEIPYGENQLQFILKETPRSTLYGKIRRAKLVASIANLRVKQLYLKYYKRYGEFTPNDHESPLSSDSEI
jgi:hypothetical protein